MDAAQALWTRSRKRDQLLLRRYCGTDEQPIISTVILFCRYQGATGYRTQMGRVEGDQRCASSARPVIDRGVKHVARYYCSAVAGQTRTRTLIGTLGQLRSHTGRN